MIEMYEAAFYRQKPRWDRFADFIYNDLCMTTELRMAVQDVQFHPVKMLVFIKFFISSSPVSGLTPNSLMNFT